MIEPYPYDPHYREPYLIQGVKLWLAWVTVFATCGGLIGVRRYQARKRGEKG